MTASTKPITQAQALCPLRQTVMAQQAKLRAFVTIPLTDYQQGALLSWQFNIGSNAGRASTLVRLLNQRLHVAAAAHFLVWDESMVNGSLVVLPGLVARRRIESAKFLGHDTVGATRRSSDGS